MPRLQKDSNLQFKLRKLALYPLNYGGVYDYNTLLSLSVGFTYMRRLFLASKVREQKSINELEKYVGGFKGKSVAYIPTASNAEDGFNVWRNGETWKLVQTLGINIDVVQLEDCINTPVISRLQNKDILWVAGGFSGYLMYWLRLFKLDNEIPKILETGTLYVGTSAGAMITGKTCEVAEWYIGEEEPGAGVIPGLGLVDFDIYPHYNEADLPQIKSMYKGNKMYLLKDGEQIIVEDNKVSVLGEERVIG